MTGYNMPPGCNVSDIPGNRPEDERAEALMDKIYEILTKQPLDKAAIFKLCDEAYQKGFQAGLADADFEILTRQTLDKAAEAIFKLCGGAYQEGYQQGIADADFAHDHLRRQEWTIDDGK